MGERERRSILIGFFHLSTISLIGDCKRKNNNKKTQKIFRKPQEPEVLAQVRKVRNTNVSEKADLNNMPSTLEPVEFVLLLRNAKGAAAISLIKQVAPVFKTGLFFHATL